MGRLGPQILDLKLNNEKFPTGKHVYNEILDRLITTNNFHGNNICNAIESLGRME